MSEWHNRRGRTGFEETKDLPLRQNDLIAGRYQVRDAVALCAQLCAMCCTACTDMSRRCSCSLSCHSSCAVQIVDFLGSAAFSRAVQALDVRSGALVCLKIIKVPSAALHCEPACLGA
jgi:hypothetical protein